MDVPAFELESWRFGGCDGVTKSLKGLHTALDLRGVGRVPYCTVSAHSAGADGFFIGANRPWLRVAPDAAAHAR